MARIKMDYNLKKLVLQVYFGEIAKKLIIVCPSQKKSFNIFFSLL